MISTITSQGKVRWMIYTGKMNAALFIVFLTRLLAGASKKVFLIVDNLSVHEAVAVDEWLADKQEKIEVYTGASSFSEPRQRRRNFPLAHKVDIGVRVALGEVVRLGCATRPFLGRLAHPHDHRR
jgi:hypothetical protein